MEDISFPYSQRLCGIPVTDVAWFWQQWKVSVTAGSYFIKWLLMIPWELYQYQLMSLNHFSLSPYPNMYSCKAECF